MTPENPQDQASAKAAAKAAKAQAKSDARTGATAAKARAKAAKTENSRGGKAAAVTVAGVVVLAGAGYVVAHQMASGRVPEGTSVAGVDIGGKDRAAARAALADALDQRAESPITVDVNGESAQIDPASAGLALDHDATIEAAGLSSSWAPSDIWNHFTGGGTVEPVVTVDEQKLAALIDTIDSEHGTQVREGKILFVDGEVKTREPRAGQVVDRAGAAKTLREAFLSTKRSVDLSVVETPPTIDEEAVATALESFANPAVSGPVTLTSGATTVTLKPTEFTPALSLEAVDGELEPTLDQKKLASVLAKALGRNGGPKEATVKLVGGKPQIVPDEKGIAFDEADLEAKFLPLVAAADGARSAEVKSVEATSDFGTEDAKKLGIVERVSSETTQFPHAANNYRNINIGRAAELINGTVLKPGETFSLNETVGERTRANGFTEGFMIADGVFKQDLGGGVSQMATTVFNSMFFAGYEDVEHKPHSFYISRYPVGREATVAWGSVDLRFRNDTDHGVLIEAKVTPSTPGSQGTVRVSMWSTKVWDITSSTSSRYAFTPAKTRTLSGPTCEPNSGYGGFEVDVKRYFHKPGSKKVEKTENFHTTYTPSDTVICKD